VTKVDNGERSRLETERAGQLEAFPNPKMHKGFTPSEVLISKDESLIFLYSVCIGEGDVQNIKIWRERSEELGKKGELQIF
jgi:hypothetical protein